MKKIQKSKRREVAQKTNGRCWYCGCHLTEVCIDHIHPKSNGGSFDEDNLVPCCRVCNSSKGNKSLCDFRKWIEWQKIGVEPFTERQNLYMIAHGIVIPCPPPVIFYGEEMVP